ncbi:RagB/SusD family nutrient uptake outer membrane protein [Draconibacterium orientale]|uniref:RagB/SusD family nutrient uptake outer membrane protein n=1 Tax=Draconibacterium orientale TaxID=1168034 RepID=UPI002ABE28C5|nr:RagB/SusD family nutrient uptake outer membrane protein [Draconibacterium orientale]
MKRIFQFKLYVLLFAIIAMVIQGCEGELEPEVYDKLTSDNFPQTEEDAKALVNSVYYEFRDGPWNRYNAANESRLVQGLFSTDEFSCYWDGYWGAPFNFTWQPDGWPFSDMYNAFVPAVTKATGAIAQLLSVESLDATLLERYIAEIKAARGYWMYDIYNLYGPVPFIVNEEDALNLTDYEQQTRPSNEEIVALIEKDLSEAAEVLPIQYSSSDFGRLTKGAALMGLVKLYLHEKNWQKVKETAEAIIDLNVYKLQSVYKAIWALENEQNSEIIFAIQNHPTLGGITNNYRAHVLPSDWASPNGYPVTAWNGYKVPWSYYDTFDEDDKRRDVLVRFYTGKKGQTIDARETSPLGAIPLKYPEDPEGTGQNQGADYVIYRYADVLLALAEALNEINGPNQRSVDLINQVRERAFDPAKSVSVSDFSSKEELRDYILQERGWELCFEGCRREDLIRHGKFVEYANDPSKMENRNPQQNARDFHKLYPIPNQAIFENPLMKQNDGY